MVVAESVEVGDRPGRVLLPAVDIFEHNLWYFMIAKTYFFTL